MTLDPEAPHDGSEDPVTAPRPAVRAMVVGVATVQVGAVVFVLTVGSLADGGVGDRLGALPLAAIYALPAVLALLALRRRGALLLPAGIASLVVAVVPFSVHSFLFVPAGFVHLLAHARWSPPPRRPDRSVVVALLTPLLLVVALGALVWHPDPICYTKDASGEVAIDRDPGAITSGTTIVETIIEPGSDVVERGCSGDTVVWWEATTSLVLSGAALLVATSLTRPTRPRPSDATPGRGVDPPGPRVPPTDTEVRRDGMR